MYKRYKEISLCFVFLPYTLTVALEKEFTFIVYEKNTVRKIYLKHHESRRHRTLIFFFCGKKVSQSFTQRMCVRCLRNRKEDERNV